MIKNYIYICTSKIVVLRPLMLMFYINERLSVMKCMYDIYNILYLKVNFYLKLLDLTLLLLFVVKLEFLNLGNSVQVVSRSNHRTSV